MKIVVGVDTHKASHAIVVLSSVGEDLASFAIPSTPAGFEDALERVLQITNDAAWGIEGAYTYGQGLADFLTDRGYLVYEVPGSVSKRHRRQSSRHGKTDPLDARAIAQAILLDGERLPRYGRSEDHEVVRLLYESRDRLVRHRTEAVNRTRAYAHHLGILDLPADITRPRAIKRFREQLSPHRGRGIVGDLRLEEIDECLREIEHLSARIQEMEKRLRPFVEKLAAKLLDLRGVSVVVASGIVGHAGLLSNCRDANAFAMRAGAAPVACSSGKQTAVRLNRGGNRQLNRLLHHIALTQLRAAEHAGRKYYDKKRAEGKSHRAAMRSLKRQLATVVYYRLRASQPAEARELIAAA